MLMIFDERLLNNLLGQEELSVKLMLVVIEVYSHNKEIG